MAANTLPPGRLKYLEGLAPDQATFRSTSSRSRRARNRFVVKKEETAVTVARAPERAGRPRRATTTPFFAPKVGPIFSGDSLLLLKDGSMVVFLQPQIVLRIEVLELYKIDALPKHINRSTASTCDVVLSSTSREVSVTSVVGPVWVVSQDKARSGAYDGLARVYTLDQWFDGTRAPPREKEEAVPLRRVFRSCTGPTSRSSGMWIEKFTAKRVVARGRPGGADVTRLQFYRAADLA
ncbi:unnamed protein product [Pelagomonas calceolata]|uniref:Uncharacterized protein n=1 Tax=Pelagomonas calceolata TaxID=35677 RepID=A0A8J2SIJ8_9STRA|nr:unnamed protein product [Pelagomonas calceolata]